MFLDFRVFFCLIGGNYMVKQQKQEETTFYSLAKYLRNELKLAAASHKWLLKLASLYLEDLLLKSGLVSFS